jgi:hypothetical protein
MNPESWHIDDEGAPQDIPATPMFGLFGHVNCGAVSPDDLVCTRPVGHGGRHAASGTSRTMAVWR